MQTNSKQHHDGENPTMSTLLLDSLEIEQFRAFQHLTIERLGQINLIVGANNTGKSCLLEALWLYARRGDPGVVWDILQRHDEIGHGHEATIGVAVAERTHGIRHLFHGRRPIEEPPQPIRIGASAPPESMLTVGIGWYAKHNTDEGVQTVELHSPDEVAAATNPTQRLHVQMGNQPGASFLFSADLFHGPQRLVSDCLNCVHILNNSIGRERLARLWDAVAGSEHVADVLEALHILVPEATGMQVTGDPTGRVRSKTGTVERVPCLKLPDQPEGIPLHSLGTGVARLLATALALVNASDGLLLVDGIESDLHFSTQEPLWRWLMQASPRRETQVFATAHTWDCVAAFQQAASANPDSDAVLVCLEQGPEGLIRGRTLAGPELANVTRESLGVC
jgi:hypothetical protein